MPSCLSSPRRGWSLVRFCDVGADFRKGSPVLLLRKPLVSRSPMVLRYQGRLSWKSLVYFSGYSALYQFIRSSNLPVPDLRSASSVKLYRSRTIHQLASVVTMRICSNPCRARTCKCQDRCLNDYTVATQCMGIHSADKHPSTYQRVKAVSHQTAWFSLKIRTPVIQHETHPFDLGGQSSWDENWQVRHQLLEPCTNLI